MRGVSTENALPEMRAAGSTPELRDRFGLRQARELALWVVVVAGVLNFAPTLFSQSDSGAAPLWTKAAKDVPLVLLFALVLVEARGRLSAAGRPHVQRLAFATAAMAVFLLATVVAAGAPTVGDVVSLRYYVLYPATAVALAAVSFGTGELQRLFTLFVALGVFEGLLAIPNFFGYPQDTFFTFGVNDMLVNRAIGTLGNPNTLGLFLGLCIIVAASGATRLPRWICAASIGVMLLGLLLTFSKTAPIALGAATFPFWRGALPRRALLTALAVGVGVAFSSSSIVVRSDFDPLTPGSTVTAPETPGQATPSTPAPKPTPNESVGETTSRVLGGSREAAARAAVDRWTESTTSTVVGHGFDSLADLDSTGELSEQTTDNMVLGLLVEGGVVGLLLFAALALSAIWPLARGPSAAPAVLVAKSYAILFLLYTPVAINFRLFPAALFFWILTAIALTILDPLPGHRSTERGALPRSRSDSDG